MINNIKMYQKSRSLKRGTAREPNKLDKIVMLVCSQISFLPVEGPREAPDTYKEENLRYPAICGDASQYRHTLCTNGGQRFRQAVCSCKFFRSVCTAQPHQCICETLDHR